MIRVTGELPFPGHAHSAGPDECWPVSAPLAAKVRPSCLQVAILPAIFSQVASKLPPRWLQEPQDRNLAQLGLILDPLEVSTTKKHTQQII